MLESFAVVFFRFQGADIRCVQIFATSNTSGSHFGHIASRNSGDDQQIYDRPHPDSRETVSTVAAVRRTCRTDDKTEMLDFLEKKKKKKHAESNQMELVCVYISVTS